MEPTPRGLQLVEAAQEILKQYEQRMLGSSQFAPGTSETEFRFAMSDIGEMVFLPRVLGYLQEHAPRASVRVMNPDPSELARGLEDASIDLAVGYVPDLKGGSYYQQRLFPHGFVCLARADHPLVGKTLTRSAFLSLGHAAVHAEGRSQEVFEQYLRKQGIERRVVLNVPHFMSIPLVIAKSDLIVTVPLAVGASFAKFTGLKLLRPPFNLPRFDLKQHWHRRFHKDARNAWARAMVASLFNEGRDEWKDARL
jgi:DNA-binding transcriptional LysR family regulator